MRVVREILNDFFSITAFSGSKNRQIGLFHRNDTQSAEYFFLIIPEKGELSKQKSHNQDDELVAENQDTKSKQEFPGPESLFIKANPGGDAPGDKGCCGSGNGKSAEDKEKMGRGNLPLLLQFFEHDAKRRKNMVSTTNAHS
jgi:hypothetical protein